MLRPSSLLLALSLAMSNAFASPEPQFKLDLNINKLFKSASDGAKAFNRHFPQAVPVTDCGEATTGAGA